MVGHGALSDAPLVTMPTRRQEPTTQVFRDYGPLPQVDGSAQARSLPILEEENPTSFQGKPVTEWD